jgi:O-antigen/teichoic acid export membrane protein
LQIKNLLNVTKYLSGQGLGLILSFISSLIIIRNFPIEEFAIYVLFAALTTVQAVGSDLGLGNCTLTLLAQSRRAPGKQGQIIAAALKIESKLVVLGLILSLSLGSILIVGMEFNYSRIPVLAVAILAFGHLQAILNIKKSRLNANQSQREIFIITLLEGLVKTLAAATTYIRPEVETIALLSILGWLLINKFADRVCTIEKPETDSIRRGLIKSTAKIAPTTLFFLIQANFAVFVLSFYNLKTSVAELGALGRLGQIIGFISLAIPIYIQPAFANLDGHSYRKSLLRLCAAAIIIFLALVISTKFGADLWVMILGARYQHLEPLIGLAVLGPAIYVLALALNAVVQAKQTSAWQNLTVGTALITQLIFCTAVGLNDTADALVFNMIPSVAMLSTQISLIAYMLKVGKY